MIHLALWIGSLLFFVWLGIYLLDVVLTISMKRSKRKGVSIPRGVIFHKPTTWWQRLHRHEARRSL